MCDFVSTIILIALVVILWTGVIDIKDGKLVIDMTKIEFITSEDKDEEDDGIYPN